MTIIVIISKNSNSNHRNSNNYDSKAEAKEVKVARSGTMGRLARMLPATEVTGFEGLLTALHDFPELGVPFWGSP